MIFFNKILRENELICLSLNLFNHIVVPCISKQQILFNFRSISWWNLFQCNSNPFERRLTPFNFYPFASHPANTIAFQCLDIPILQNSVYFNTLFGRYWYPLLPLTFKMSWGRCFHQFSKNSNLFSLSFLLLLLIIVRVSTVFATK